MNKTAEDAERLGMPKLAAYRRRLMIDAWREGKAEPTCSSCGQDSKHCSPLLKTETGWIGLAHLPRLGKAADRRSFR